MAIRFGVLSTINGFDEILECKSLRLSRVRFIKGALRFHHFEGEEETPRNDCHLIFIRCSGCVYVSTGVHRSLLISVVITL